MATKKTFQSLAPGVEDHPLPRSVVPPPYTEPAPTEIHYPSSDGKPLADDTWQANAMISKYYMLTVYFEGDPNTFVGMDLLLYYTKDKPEDVVAPDVFVVFGVPDNYRHNYQVWEEGKVPDFVLEVASKSSVRENLGWKKDVYERIGVPEYCVFDPQGCLHWPRLQLFRLEGGVYERVSTRDDRDSPLAVTSETLGLELRFEQDRFRLWNPKTREYLLEHSEERAKRLEERAKRLGERAGRLEERARRIEAEQRTAQARRRIAQAQQRTEQFRQRTDQANRRAEAESLTCRELEAKIADLEDQLRRLT